MPLLVTSGPRVLRKQRCGLPNAQAYEEDRKFVFINNLYNESQEQSEGITSFFVLRSKYFAFFSRLKRASVRDPLSSGTATGRRGSSHNHIQAAFEHMEEDTSSGQDRTDEIGDMDIVQENFEQDRLELERLEQEQLERGRVERERLERERLERERLERERQEMPRIFSPDVVTVSPAAAPSSRGDRPLGCIGGLKRF
jgi:hypothetical protein